MFCARRACALALALAAVAGPSPAAVVTEGEVIFEGDSTTVGRSQDGSLTITPPDAPEYEELIIGENVIATGEVVVDGARLTVDDETVVGDRGFGALEIINGAQYLQTAKGTGVDRESYLFVGREGTGLLRVEGEGSLVDLRADITVEPVPASLYVGSLRAEGFVGLAQGEVEVLFGATIVSGDTFLGTHGSADVRIDGQGTLWRSLDEIRAAHSSVSITNGAKLVQSLNSVSGGITFGVGDQKTNVLISGAGSLLSTDREIVVGEDGQAVVRVEAGARVSAETTSIAPFGTTTARGEIQLDGIGTSWTTERMEFRSSQGDILISITNGASLNVTKPQQGVALLGESSGFTSLSIDGPQSRWNVGLSHLHVGAFGDAEFRLSGGARHTNQTAMIGGGNHHADVVVTEPGSSWEVFGQLEFDNGRLIVSDNAEVLLPPQAIEIDEESEIRLDQGSLRPTRFGNFGITNRGLFGGDGAIEGSLWNEETGVVKIGNEQELSFTSSQLINYGTIEITGGKLKSPRRALVLNFSEVVFRGATLDTILYNQDDSIFSVGTRARILGGANRFLQRVLNSGEINATGTSTTTFFDEVSNTGRFTISDGSVVHFLGSYSGVNLYGDGHAVFEGDVEFREETNENRFSADLEFSASADWLLTIGGLSPGLIDSTGVVDLGGELSPTVEEPLAAPGLHELMIIQAELVEDQFDFLPVIDTHLGSHAYYRGVEYTDTSVTLLIEQFAAGDYNGDGAIDATDYDAWTSSFGLIGEPGFVLADGNLDGVVDAADYTVWRDAFELATVAVPEPATGWGVICGALALFARRFRRI